VAWISWGQFRIVIHNPSSHSEPICSQASEEGGENCGRRSLHSKMDHQYLPPVSPIPGSCNLRLRTQSIHLNGLDTHL
jgi:hypothetical protein